MFSLRKEIKENYKNRGQDKSSVILKEDLQRINGASNYMWKFPLAFGLLYRLNIKLFSMVGFPELLSNPLKETLHSNQNVTQGFRRIFKLQGLSLAILLGFMVGVGVCEVTRFCMFLKYQNLVNSYVGAKNKDWKDVITFKDSTFTK